ncbi:DNA-entry nuclease [Aerococcus agrisoli]|uniref:DNA-entry nuclease n=1 Tax=Aerococcus agrisoli TaxID=2487350 RepID=A0A3N4GB18_9LACT|nr:DNA/RNA non-specific endonuclease [Aerococcus agrisoli]RPA57766.1 DNA-entry nuclease [Aerococcus agrisoli]
MSNWQKKYPKIKSILSVLLLTMIISFLFLGNRYAQENLAEPVEVAKEVSQTSSIYQEILEEQGLASSSSKVKQAQEGAKTNPDAQASVVSEQAEASQSSTSQLAQSEANEITSNDLAESQTSPTQRTTQSNLENVHTVQPKVPSGQSYVAVNNNVPIFTDEEITGVGDGWEKYGALDDLGRVTAANALLTVDLMPADAEVREGLTSVTPTGWMQEKYDSVDGGWLYNRSHLIGYQLTGQQDNMLNLMTGTRYFNVEGMLPFENYVASYIEDTENHVRYRITPLFIGDELLARGIFMEAYSIEDQGELQFHVYVPNVQPGVELDYQTGASKENS